MRSLSSMVKEYGESDPLAQAVRALLDAGLVVATRDGAGRFVQMSDVFGAALELDDDVRGNGFIRGQRYYDTSGRELTKTEHPAQIARMSGVAQRNRIIGVRAPNGREIWIQASFMPLEREPGGWSVLTVGVPLTSRAVALPHEPQQAFRPWSDVVVSFALSVAGASLSPCEMAERMRPPVEAIVPHGAGGSFVHREGDWLHITPVKRPYAGAPLQPTRLSGEALRRWSQPSTVYEPELPDTAIVGTRVAIEYPVPPRSYALIPIGFEQGLRRASLAVTSPDPHALEQHQIAALEQICQLAAPALTLPQAA